MRWACARWEMPSLRPLSRPSESSGNVIKRAARSRFDVREERVLLRLVEAVDLVDEEDRLAPHLESLLGVRHHLAHSWNPFSDGREGDEVAIGVLGDQPAEGGLAGAGRALEHHGADAPLLDRIA